MTVNDILGGLMDGTLKPRYHTGVGFMQLYITDNHRLHVWHPDLPASLESFGNRHNHRFDMKSTVLMGKVVDTKLYATAAGVFDVYTVMPAHHGETPVPKLTSSNRGVSVEAIRVIKEGEVYGLRRGEFHESRAEGLTVTLMEKSNQSEKWASILAHRDQAPKHGMEHNIPSVKLEQMFFSALRKLSKSSADYVEAETR